MEIDVRVERLPLRAPVRITGYTFIEVPVIVVELREGEHVGRGEAAGIYYRAESPQRMIAQIDAIRPVLSAGADRSMLAHLLLPGGARNALDCAFWDLEAKRTGKPAWQLAGLQAPVPKITTYTLGADDPDAMAQLARSYPQARALKLKLTGEPIDAERVRAVRAVRPDVWLGVDANQGFGMDSLRQVMPAFIAADVRLIEQPVPPALDDGLPGLQSPIPIAADESVLCLADLPRCVGRFDAINIKLDKCGGLTEALAMARVAKVLGFKVMVGNMGGSSLAMAPGFLLAQLCDLVDLDGPLVLANDRSPGVIYEDGHISCPESLWGNPVVTRA
ncbi:dipeptide epimerase [Steroidobacter agaridevorans]|uniref:Dipeptide epimerase n=1 Tax=Steroidobacter agaridevorans TaxID=2695856 RepID=A0A829YPX9_9GAMM|nr:dipeptide epimerase [Steroidobacter agaridevorans]GFE84832.1 dipeptide epimerase [Steroidobacter agaridevorans]